MAMNLPPEFVSNMQNVFEEDGSKFLDALPDLIARASRRWGLTDVQPFDNLSYNFVALARRADNDVVLKIGVPQEELISEIEALRLFHGEGACQLIDADAQQGFLLLERLHPGDMLSTLEDDEEATHIAAGVMQKIWRPLEDVTPGVTGNKFIRLSDWFDGLKKLRPLFNGGTGPFNEKLVERVERSVGEFFAENHQPVLMHGDFHHFNILSC